jgi:hypothetical protein
MAWSTPKTDWFGATDAEGIYIGDRFNVADFNRIKNNLEYLKGLAAMMYPGFSISAAGADRTPEDYFYADEINLLEGNLNTVNANTLNQNYGSAPIYAANGNTMDFIELNRLESAILDLYERLNNQSEGRRMFTWNFGMKGGVL